MECSFRSIIFEWQPGEAYAGRIRAVKEAFLWPFDTPPSTLFNDDLFYSTMLLT